MQDCCFHRTEPLAAVGLVSGRVQAFRIDSSKEATTSTATEVLSRKPHKDSCRAVRFTVDGNRLLTASADRSEHGKPKCTLSEFLNT